jgi:NAD(P)-dependent dehydrogenase (short-subunit alcohol dehydrogenase family)
LWHAVRNKSAEDFLDCFFIESRFDTPEVREANRKQIEILLSGDIIEIEVADIPDNELVQIMEIQNAQPASAVRYSLVPRKMLWVRQTGQIAYVATKSALDAMTLTLSSELAGCGTTVNAVDPGPTDTVWITDEVRSELLRKSPEGISSAERIGCLVRRLAGDDAASITGQIIRAQAAGTAALFTKGNGQQIAPHEPPPRVSVSEAPGDRKLDSQAAPGSSGGR